MRYINGVAGAPCTTHLKRNVRKEWESKLPDEPITYVWGLDSTERERATRLKANNSFNHEFPLIDRGLTKENVHCLADELGIKRPEMYELGYHNNNCIGCVKGGKGYWNRIRKDFPEVFESRAKLEREIGHSCIKGVFLDELNPDAGRNDKPIQMQCSLACLGFE